jgi:LCP family protein required for cell wall assembly
VVAAALSFLWPGLGQWYAGRPRAGLVYAIPILALAALLIVYALEGLTTFAVRLLDPSFSLTLLILIVIAGVWRLLSIVDAAMIGRATRPSRWRSRGMVAALVVAVIGTHALAASYAYSFYAAGSKIFVAQGPTTDQIPAGPSPILGASPSPSDDYNVPPFATPSTSTARITVLLTGIDHTASRTESLTDTIMVVSVDPVTKQMVMISFPRDLARFPLYLGGTYYGKINSLMTAATDFPKHYPDGPLPTLAKEVGYLLGVPIQYFAAVDLDGFRKMIDAVGGVTVTVDRAINDPKYDWLDGSPYGFYLKAGTQHLNSRIALAYVRSRYGAGDNDFTRAARQQQLLVALRQQMTDPANIGELPAVLAAAADTIRTNFPPDRLDEMVGLAEQLGDGSIQRFVLQPPTYSVHPPTASTGGQYTLELKLPALRTLSVDLFGEDSAYWSGNFSPAGSPIPLTAPG